MTEARYHSPWLLQRAPKHVAVFAAVALSVTACVEAEVAKLVIGAGIELLDSESDSSKPISGKPSSKQKGSSNKSLNWCITPGGIKYARVSSKCDPEDRPLIADSRSSKSQPTRLNDKLICLQAVTPAPDLRWETYGGGYSQVVAEARSRGLSLQRCATLLGRSYKPQRTETALGFSDDAICTYALTPPPKLEWSTDPNYKAYVNTARSRGLSLQRCATLLEREVPPKSIAKPKSTPPSSPSQNRNQIIRIQRGLASLGYDAGAVDGVLGAKTMEAIRAFQKDYDFPVTGKVSERLDVAIRTAFRVVASRKTQPKPEPKRESTGSGIIVSAQGHILTNHHVVKGCTTTTASTTGTVRPAGLKVQPKPAEPQENRSVFKANGLNVIGIDARNDLALLKSAKSVVTAVAFRDGRGIRTGDDIVVTGFPLQGVLSSEINVSKGIVSSLAGPGDDRRLFQITAPVQSGNSGGPVLDASGNAVGVVVSRLDAIKIARLTGTLPQNVNFAISEGTARAFLDSHDVPYQTAESHRPKSTADIAAEAKGYTVLIECWK